MLLSIPISPETETRLRTRANAAGVDVAAYASSLLEQTTKSPLSLEEISGPVAEDFAASGMTDDEFGDLLEEVKHEMRAERRARHGS
jgi:hypothetical protein